MNKKKKFIIFIIIFLILSIPFVVYAAFTFSTKVQADITNGKIEFIDSNQKITATNSTITFSDSFETKTCEYQIQNNSEFIISYQIQLLLSTEPSTICISNAVLIYDNDSNYIGVASDFYQNQKLAANNILVLPNETIVYKLTYELHNGIEIDKYDSTSINIKTLFIASTVNNQEYSMVSNEVEFGEAINAINSGMNKTIILKNDLALSNNYQILNTGSINFNGFILSNVNLSISNYFSFYRNGGFTGSITLDSENSFLYIADEVNTIGTITINLFNESYLESIIAEQISKSNPLKENDSFYLLGVNNSYYLNKINISLEEGLSITNGQIAARTELKTYIARITINSDLTYDLMVIGSKEIDIDSTNTKLFDYIINNELKHISYYKTPQTDEEYVSRKTLSSDLFLPTSLKKYNCTIIWHSSNEDLISSDGKVPVGSEGDVTLTSYIKINDNIYTYDFNISIAKETNEMKMQRLISELEVILKYLYDSTDSNTYFELPSTDSSNGYYALVTSLGIQNIEYSIDDKYTYLSLYGKNLGLNSVTFDTYAQVNISVKFYNSEKLENGVIDVVIDLSENNELINKIISELQVIINNIDVLQNMLDTRIEGLASEKGDFTMPIEYKGFIIEYLLPEEVKNYCYEINSGNIIIHPEYFEVVDSSNTLLVNIYAIGNDSPAGCGEIHFTTPAAIHCDSSGFNDETLFYSIKLQVLQQSLHDLNLTIPNTYSGISSIFEEVKHNDYILIYDILRSGTLIVEVGNQKTTIDSQDIKDLQAVIEWALCDTIKSASSLGFISSDYSWIPSNGNSYITDGEEAVILSYCKKYPFFEAYWNKILYSSLIKDNTLTNLEQTDLETILIDPTYSAIINWITSNSGQTSTLSNYLTDNGLALDSVLSDVIGNYKNDGLESISSLEEETIVRYCWYKGYEGFYTKWREYITYVDNVLEEYEISYSTTDNYTKNSYSGTVNLSLYNSLEYDNTTSFDNNLSIAMLYLIYTWANYNASRNPNDDDTLLNWIVANLKISNNSIDSTTALFLLKRYGISEYAGYKNVWEYSYGSSRRIVDETELVVLRKFGEYNSFNNNGYFSSSYLSTTNSEAIYTETNIFKTRHVSLKCLDTLVSEVKKVINNLSVNENISSLISWATSTKRDSVVLKYIDSNSVVQNLNLVTYDYTNGTDVFVKTSNVYNSVISDGLSTISYPEYITIISYLMSDYYSTEQKTNTSGANIYNALTFFLSMGFNDKIISSDQHIEDGGEFMGLIESLDLGFDLTEYTNLILWATASGEENSSISHTVGTNEYFSDGLSTICLEEYNAILAFIDSSNLSEEIKNLFAATISKYLSNLNNNSNYTLSLNDFIDYYDLIIPTSYDNYYYLQNAQFEANALIGLSYFKNLTKLYLRGNDSISLFKTSAVADEVFDLITKNCLNLSLLDVQYNNLTNIDKIENLTYLTYIDLKGNSNISSIIKINEIDNGQILYLNIFGLFTDLEFSFEEPLVIKLYYSYYNSNNSFSPYLVYSLKGIETIYKPTKNYTSDELLAMKYCYFLKEIGSITNQRMNVTSKIVISDTKVYDITWASLTEGIVSVEDGINGKYLLRKYKTEGSVIITATVNVNGYYFTRYFVVALPQI